MAKIQRIRRSCFNSQHGKCYYCQQPMWHQDSAAFATAHNITTKCARLFQATAEHLKPRSEGGGNARTNIVAACLFCNNSRHRAKSVLTPEKYRAKIRRLMAKGKWHGLRLMM